MAKGKKDKKKGKGKKEKKPKLPGKLGNMTSHISSPIKRNFIVNLLRSCPSDSQTATMAKSKRQLSVGQTCF